MLTLKNAVAMFLNLNVRAEHHGDETMPAVDLTFKTRIRQEDLTSLHPDLAGVLFVRDEGEGDDEALTRPRFAALGSIAWGDKTKDVRVVIATEEKKKDDGYLAITLPTCSAYDFSLTPKAGGFADVKFKIQLNPDSGDVGRMTDLLGHDVYLTMSSNQARLVP